MTDVLTHRSFARACSFVAIVSVLTFVPQFLSAQTQSTQTTQTQSGPTRITVDMTPDDQCYFGIHMPDHQNAIPPGGKCKEEPVECAHDAKNPNQTKGVVVGYCGKKGSAQEGKCVAQESCGKPLEGAPEIPGGASGQPGGEQQPQPTQPNNGNAAAGESGSTPLTADQKAEYDNLLDSFGSPEGGEPADRFQYAPPGALDGAQMPKQQEPLTPLEKLKAWMFGVPAEPPAQSPDSYWPSDAQTFGDPGSVQQYSPDPANPPKFNVTDSPFDYYRNPTTFDERYPATGFGEMKPVTNQSLLQSAYDSLTSGARGAYETMRDSIVTAFGGTPAPSAAPASDSIPGFGPVDSGMFDLSPYQQNFPTPAPIVIPPDREIIPNIGSGPVFSGQPSPAINTAPLTGGIRSGPNTGSGNPSSFGSSPFGSGLSGLGLDTAANPVRDAAAAYLGVPPESLSFGSGSSAGVSTGVPSGGGVSSPSGGGIANQPGAAPATESGVSQSGVSRNKADTNLRAGLLKILGLGDAVMPITVTSSGSGTSKTPDAQERDEGVEERENPEDGDARSVQAAVSGDPSVPTEGFRGVTAVEPPQGPNPLSESKDVPIDFNWSSGALSLEEIRALRHTLPAHSVARAVSQTERDGAGFAQPSPDPSGVYYPTAASRLQSLGAFYSPEQVLDLRTVYAFGLIGLKPGASVDPLSKYIVGGLRRAVEYSVQSSIASAYTWTNPTETITEPMDKDADTSAPRSPGAQSAPERRSDSANPRNPLRTEKSLGSIANLMPALMQLLQSLFGGASSGTPEEPRNMPPSTPASVSLGAEPHEVGPGRTARLFWTSSGTSGCVVYGANSAAIFGGGASGNITSPEIQATTTFALMCVAQDGTRVHASTTVTVNPESEASGAATSTVSDIPSVPDTAAPPATNAPTQPPPATSNDFCDPNVGIDRYILCLESTGARGPLQ